MSTEEVTTPFLEKKKEQLSRLKQSVDEMQKDIEERREKRKREQERKDVMLWLENIIFPFLEEIAAGFNEPLVDGIKRLIREKKNPFQPTKTWNRTQETYSYLDAFFNTPQIRVLFPILKPYLKYNMQWIFKEASWIREEVLKEEYPDIYTAIMETEGGKEWMDGLIGGFLKVVRRYIA